MIDKADSNNVRTQTIDLDVISDVCEPNIDLSNIVLASSYTYTLGDPDVELVDVADFSNGDCKVIVTAGYLVGD